MTKKTSEDVVRIGSAELSKRLGLSRVTLHRLSVTGKFPKFHKVRGLKKWFLAEVEQWEEKEMASAHRSPDTVFGKKAGGDE